MDLFRKIGGMLTRHYEKVLLALALVGLVLAVVLLYQKRQAEDQTIREYDQKVLRGKAKELPSVDIAAMTNALQQAKNPPALNFGLPHNVFNPVKWQRRPDGSVLKIDEESKVGAAALRTTKITPLNTVISLDRMAGGSAQMSVIQEASTNRAFRVKSTFFIKTNETDRTKLFTVREIRGTPEAPEVVVELSSGEQQSVTIDKPFRRVDGYKADLVYPPSGATYADKRVDEVLSIAGEDYIIVAINPNEIVVSARSNNRRTTIRNNAAP